MAREIEGVGHVANGFGEADAWDQKQLLETTIDERLRIAEGLRERVYGPDAPDVRESRARR